MNDITTHFINDATNIIDRLGIPVDDQQNSVVLTKDVQRHVMTSHELNEFISRNSARLASRNLVSPKSTCIEAANDRLL